MNDFMLKRNNDVKIEKEVSTQWNDRTQFLTQLNEQDRRDAIQFIGEDHIYRFKFVGIVSVNNEQGDFGSLIDIMADSYEEAEQAALDYFIAKHIEIISFYQERAYKHNGECSFKLMNLYTAEEAEEENKKYIEEEEEFENFLSLI